MMVEAPDPHSTTSSFEPMSFRYSTCFMARTAKSGDTGHPRSAGAVAANLIRPWMLSKASVCR